MQRKSELKSGNVWQSIESVIPEKLASHLGETFISPQNFRGLPLLSGYYAPFSLLTVHSMNRPTVPLCIHKLPPHCKDVLLTDRFIFITNPSSQILTVVSCKLSESTPEENNEYNPESVIQSFSFADGEQLLGIFKKTGAKAKREEKGLRGGASVVRGGSDSKSVGISWDKKQASPSILLNLNLSQSSAIENGGMKKSGSLNSDPSPSFIRTVERINVLSSENREVDTCIAVTTCGAYELQLRQCPTDLFLELALKKGELEEAERVAQVFNLNLQHLLEIAGDLELASKSFVQAIAFYKLSRLTSQPHILGPYSFSLSSNPFPLFSKVNFNYVCGSLHLRRPQHGCINLKPVIQIPCSRFLHDNQHYDEVLAVSVVGQTALWEPLKFLCSRRGLHREALSSLSRFLKSVAEDGLKGNDLIGHKLGSSTSPVAATLLDSGLWECLSEPALLQPFLEKPELAAAHMSFINTFLPVLTIPSLECQHLKSVLKFAAGGHSVELLSFIETVFGSGGSDLAPSERIHLSNLAVMAHVERVLRSSASSSSSLSDDSGKVAKRSYSPTLMGKFL
ncbi:hypothetical protein J437_LFUL016137 [Ladona fulva]|uniref:Uncharacterized protein n=1 Tax=Ladona fulva TaxID=123851 RepID=A0A8K0KIE1_LADFU|nr:hypothetical protein J437_LFUL016137 [Ladona fulva]